MDPTIRIAGVPRRSVIPPHITRLGGVRRHREGIGEGVDAVSGPRRAMVCGMEARVVQRAEGGVLGRDLGEEPHALSHGGLEGPAIGRVGTAMDGQDLAEREEV